ncbi:oligosaccharide flippase family protein, partial [Rhizobiaceae sp. 2RAB30]
MNAAPGQFGRVAVRGGLLTGGAQGIKIAVQFLSVVVLARLLAPEDFGLVAAVGPIVAFVGLFQNLGLQQAVI